MNGIGKTLLNTTLILTTAMSSIEFCKAQQRVQYTQYMYDGVLINPALAGAEEALSLIFLSRNQWSSLDGAPSTQTIAAHAPFQNGKLGLGLLLSNDRIGVHNDWNILSTFAYHMPVSRESILSFGMQVGLARFNSDFSQLNNAAGDPLLNTAGIQKTNLDLGAGIILRSPKFRIGYSVPTFLPGNIDLIEGNSIRLNYANHFLFTQYRLPLNPSWDLFPSLLLKKVIGLPLSYDINVNFAYRDVLTTGLSYRKNESVDWLINLHLTPQLQLGYSYDYPLMQIRNFSNGSHEFMIRYIFLFIQPQTDSPR